VAYTQVSCWKQFKPEQFKKQTQKQNWDSWAQNRADLGLWQIALLEA
jgi:hypothetical protein